MKFTKADWISLGKGLIIALIGAALTYLTEWLTGQDFGDYTPIIVAFWGVITNIIRKAIDTPVKKRLGISI